MKTFRWILALTCLGIVGGLLWITFRPPNIVTKRVSHRQFCLLSDYSTGMFLSQIKQGAKMAAEENACSLLIQSLSVADPHQQLENLKKKGTTDVIYTCIGGQNAEKVRAACQLLGLRAVGIGPSVENGVWSDDYAAGQQLAQLALAAPYERVVVMKSLSSLDDERLRGVTDALPLEKIDIICDGLYGSETQLIALCNEDSVGILALNSDSLERVAQYKAQGILAPSVPLIGISQRQQTENLENGRITSVLYPSPFAIGYLAVDRLLGASPESRIGVPYTLIDLSNLYDAKNVRVAFPLFR